MMVALDLTIPKKSLPELSWLDVPTDVENNLLWRIAVREWAINDVDRQNAIKYWCARDLKLFINGFCWLVEPRDDRVNGRRTDKILPFILWDNQNPACDQLMEHLGLEDIGFDKSRGEGASWCVLMTFLREWLYRPMSSFGLVSRTELAADNPQDPDSLMWKLDFELKQLPGWMVPNYDRNTTRHTLVNLDNGSSITGYSATGDVARGGRKTAFMMDELASFKPGEDQAAMNSTQHVSNCRILVSTPKGPFGVFYEAMKGTNSMKRIRLRWQDNPLRRRGMYVVSDGEVQLRDWKYWRKRAGQPQATQADINKVATQIKDETSNNPFSYAFMISGPFVRDGRERSPWYDAECRRPGATPRAIAQELDLDYSGANAMFFDIALLEKLQRETCVDALYRGDLLFDENPHDLNLKFARRAGGLLEVWIGLTPGNFEPPHDREYGIGADMGAGLAGTMTSNSTLIVSDLRAGEQVAQFASPAVPPEQLAWIAFALGHWFRGPTGPAMICPEANGTWGGSFIKSLRELGYGNIFRRDQDQLGVIARRKSKKYGWWSDKNSKPILLQDFHNALSKGQYKVRSRILLEEAKCYVVGPDQVPIHLDAMTSDDPSGAGGNHGDRVMGGALSWRVAQESGSVRKVKTTDDPVLASDTVGGRFKSRAEEVAQKMKYVWGN